MANELLNPSIIAKEALMQLDNNLVMAKLVHRGYEDEYDKRSNGNKIGDTISIRRPNKYSVRSGAVMNLQDTIEGKTSIVVDTQEGVDFSFTSADMTLKITDFSERYIKPAMISLANSVDRKLHALYKDVWNWVGTPGQVINSFSDFTLAPQRLDEMAVPDSMRYGVLSPADRYAMLGTLSTQFNTGVNNDALKKAKLPEMAGVDLFSTQNVSRHTVGDHGGTPLVDGASQNVTYASVKDTMSQTLITDGWSTSDLLKQGDVFTIDGVYAINPVTKEALSYLQQFVVKSDVTTNANSANDTELTISPPIITSGPYQTVSAAPDNDAPINYLGTAVTAYNQNMVFNKNAFALCMVPMEIPQGSVGAVRESYKGFSARMIPVYDGVNDVSKFRLDLLYGVKAIYPDLATRISGSA